MKAFADSGWFIALHNKKDVHHKEMYYNKCLLRV